LDKRLQDGDSLAKWKSRSWLGVYIGHSLVHAGNVPVVYNPLRTTHVSPQYHVVFDDQFTSLGKSAASIPEDFFSKLFSSALWEYQTPAGPVTEDIYTFDSYWLPPVTSASKRSRTKADTPSSTSSANLPSFESPFPSSSASVALAAQPLSPASLHCDL
jgi:hypothetical protein